MTGTHTEDGHFSAGETSVAYQVMVDSVGTESWTLLVGYLSDAQLRRWLKRKTELCLDLSLRLIPDEHPVAGDPLKELWQLLDAATDPVDFDMDTWASERGIALRDRQEGNDKSESQVLSREECRREWRRSRQWTILKGFFRADDVNTPDSFFAASDYMPNPMRYAI